MNHETLEIKSETLAEYSNLFDKTFDEVTSMMSVIPLEDPEKILSKEQERDSLKISSQAIQNEISRLNIIILGLRQKLSDVEKQIQNKT